MKQILSAFLISSLSAVAHASDLTIPNTFTANSPAVAAEVNANFSATETAVDDNNVRITANENAIAAIAAPLRVVRDIDSSVVGSLLSTDNRSWTVLNQQSYIVKLTGDGFPASELVYFTGLNCTGTPYLFINNTGGAATTEQSNPVYAKQGYVFSDFLNNGVYYVAKNTPATSSFTHLSRILSSSCQATTATIDAIQAATNVEGLTGVPDAGYGAVSLE